MPCWWFCRQFLGGAFVKSRIATISFVSPVLPSARNSSAPAGRIFMKFDIWVFFRNFVEAILILLKHDKNNGFFTVTPMWSKVKCTLVQALSLCTGRMAYRGSRGIALLFYDHGTRRGWGVSVTPRPLFTPGKDPVPIVQEAGLKPMCVYENIWLNSH